MRQLFVPGADAILRLAMLTVSIGTVVVLVVLGIVALSDYAFGVGVAPKQSMPFSH